MNAVATFVGATATGDGRPVSAVLGALAAGGLTATAPVVSELTVLDSFDGRLHAAGLRLVHRNAPTSEVVLSGARVVPARLAVPAAPRFAAELPPGPLRSRLSDLLEVRALLPLVSFASSATTLVRRDASGKILVTATVHDQPTLAGAPSSIVPWSVEVAELPGYPRAAAELRDHLTASGLRRVDEDTIALALAAAGVDPSGFNSSPTVKLDPTMPAIEAYRVVFANLALAITANWQGTVDEVDPEFLHELRVAVRRTRSVLAQAKDVLLPGDRDRFREEFGWLGEITGPPRDLDVYLIEWDGYLEGLSTATAAALAPVREHLVGLHRDAHRRLAADLSSARAAELRASWAAWLGDPAQASARGDEVTDARRPVGAVVARRIRRAQRRLLAHGRAISAESPAEDLHELRKDAKKLRYLLECFGGLLESKPRKAFVQQLKALQDNLGEHQDNEVHVTELHAMAGDLAAAGVAPATLVAVGELVAHLDQRRLAARDEFAERFGAYDAKGGRGVLDAMLDDLLDESDS
jgi:CHAD domain-containing protein